MPDTKAAIILILKPPLSTPKILFRTKDYGALAAGSDVIQPSPLVK
jgi:hypothetical protein